MKRKRFRRGYVLILVTVIMMTSFLLVIVQESYAGNMNQEYLAEITGTIIEPQNLYAQSAALIDADSGRILFAKNGQTARPMASTTKIMTCILALEKGNLDDIVTASSYAASQPEVHLGVRAGVQIVLRDLLYSLMLESHNDAAVMIAEHIGGSVEGFADMMNLKGREIGCKDTYFITPNGLDEEDERGVHHTTAEDLARIMKYCIQDSEESAKFLSISQTQQYIFSDCAQVYNYTCNNHNAFLNMMDGAIAGKTGFTNDAGYCYVGALERDGKKLIVSLLACGWPNHKGYKWSDTRTLMLYGIENFDYITIDTQKYNKEIENKKICVVNGIPDYQKLSGISTVALKVGKNQSEESSYEENQSERVLMRHDQKMKVVWKTEDLLHAPVEKGREVGRISYYLEEKIVKEEVICTKEEVKERSLKWCMNQLLMRSYLLNTENNWM